MLDIPTAKICRQASEYLHSLKNLPDKEIEFINRFPYASALAFAVGADATTWVKHSIGYGWNLMNDGLGANRRETGFPITYLYQFGEYALEMRLTAVLGFNYEVDYMRKNGGEVKDYQYSSLQECIDDYKKDNVPSMHIIDLNKEKDLIALKYFQYRNIAEMFKDGTGKIHPLMEEAVAILEYVIKRKRICIDGNRDITESNTDYSDCCRMVREAVNVYDFE